MNPLEDYSFEETYTCTIHELSPSPVYGEFTSDYRIEFTYDADAGEISRLLALNEIPFIYYQSNIVLSKKALNELVDETSELWR